MHIAIVATGTRGDVQPVIALGRELQKLGQRVRVAAGANHIRWIESFGLETFATRDSAEVMHSAAGIRWAESGGGLGELRAMRALTQASDPGRFVDDMLRATEGAELLIGGIIEEPYLQAIAEKRGSPQLTFALSPYRPTRSGAASLMLPLLPRSDARLNRWAGRLAQHVGWSISGDAVNLLRRKLGLAPHSARSYFRIAPAIPALYAFSRYVVPPVTDAHAYTTGYCFLEAGAGLPERLQRFIDAGDAPIYAGFGSMPSSDPARVLRLIGDTLARLGRRGVVSLGAQLAPAELPKHLCVAGNVDHAALFPHMAALVHHGGAGTTAAGLRAGVPALIVPHLADQPFWGRRVYELGLGPKPLPRSKLSAATLAQRLDVLLSDPGFGRHAALLGERIRAEQGAQAAAAWIGLRYAR